MNPTLSNASGSLMALLLGSGSLPAATTLFSDNFSDVTSGSVLISARTAATGSWATTAGAPAITGAAGGGYVESQFARRVIDANFATALGTGEILTVKWNVGETAGTFGAGYSGIRLLTGATVSGYIGSTALDTDFWQLAKAHDSIAPDSVTNGLSLQNGNEAGVATLTYDSVSGLGVLSVVGGVGGNQVRSTNLNLGANLGISALRIENNSGGDFRFSALNATADAAPAGIFNNAAGGSWGTAANWRDNVVPGGAGSAANFGFLDYSGQRTVTLDSNRTVGTLILGDLSTSSGGVVTLAAGTGGNLILESSSAAAPEIQVNNSSSNITAQLQGTQGLTKHGAGTVTLDNTANASTFSGTIRLNQGILGASSDLALGAVPGSYKADAIVIDGGSLANMTNSISGSATQFGSGHNLIIDQNRGITLINGSQANKFRIGYDTSRYMQINSVITGAGGLNKEDGGNLILTAANTYTGTTSIDGGRIYLLNTTGSGTGTGNVTIRNNSMLGGTGTAVGGAGKTFTLETSGFLRIGTSHNGTTVGNGLTVSSIPTQLTLGKQSAPENLTMNLGGIMEFDLSGTQSDMLKLYTTGTVNFTGAQLNIAALSSTGWTEGLEWQLIDWTGATVTNTTTLAAYNAQLNGFDVVGDVRGNGYYLKIIPEPSAMLLSLIGAIAFLRRRR